MRSVLWDFISFPTLISYHPQEDQEAINLIIIQNTMNTEAAASVNATATAPSAIGVLSEEDSNNIIKPLQIHDQCHVQWHGTNHNAIGSSSSNNHNSAEKKSSDTSNQAASGTVINLPAIVVERRIARKRSKRRNDDSNNTNTNNNNNNPDTSTGDSTNNNHTKRQRNSLLSSNKKSNNGDIPKSSSLLDVTTIIMKKEMYDTLPADALEYYIHYLDHDRYVFYLMCCVCDC